MQTFELPDTTLMQLIQDFSRPLGRRDWRTCKRREAECIELDTRGLLDKCTAYAEESDFTIRLKLDMQTWTHYGRIRILDRPPPWDGVSDCWYVQRCATLHHGIVEPPATDAPFDAYYANMMHIVDHDPEPLQHPVYESEPSEYNYVPEFD